MMMESWLRGALSSHHSFEFTECGDGPNGVIETLSMAYVGRDSSRVDGMWELQGRA